MKIAPLLANKRVSLFHGIIRQKKYTFKHFYVKFLYILIKVKLKIGVITENLK